MRIGKFAAGMAGGVLSLAQPVLAADAVLPEMTVTGTREQERKAETPANVGTIGGGELREVGAAHPGDVLSRMSGVTVVPTNGEGHSTAIRHPITTGAVYLYLEDGVPTRSTGFFNHNALYEVNLPQAGGVEILKGPGSALHGSDAIGGVVNALTRPPSLTPEAEISVEAGSYGWKRALASFSDSWGDDGVRADLNVTKSDGWRRKTGYERQSGTVRWDRALSDVAMLKTVLTASNIDQETAGTSRLSIDDYYNSPRTNYSEISYRRVKAVRFSTAYEREQGAGLLSLTPYARWNSMDLMPNWTLANDPNISTTGHSSLGLLAKYRHDFAPWRSRVVMGADFDYSPGSYEQNRIVAVKQGAIYKSYTVAEKQYDYEATFMMLSPYVHAETSPTDKLRLHAGVRVDAVKFDYETNLAPIQTGNKRRPANTTVDYLHASPKLGATYAFTPEFHGFAAYRHAFRTPSAGQLFEQGNAENTVDLKPVKVNSYEIGFRGPDAGRFTYEVSAYYMIKKDDIVTYTDPSDRRQATNAGETLHKGVEVAAGYQLLPEWRIDGAGSYSTHTYEEWQPSTTVDYSGKDISSAPLTTANVRLGYRPQALPGSHLEFEWVHFGKYWLDDANTQEYSGHELFNLRGSYQVTETVKLFGRLLNLGDRRYATLGSYSASRGVELAPGLPRTFYVGAQVTF